MLPSAAPLRMSRGYNFVPAKSSSHNVNKLNSLFSALSISNSVKNANTVNSHPTVSRLPIPVKAIKINPILPWHTSLRRSLPDNVSTAIRAPVTQRIQERHERIVAKLATINKKPKQHTQSTKPVNQLVSAATTPVTSQLTVSTSAPVASSAPSFTAPSSIHSSSSMPAPVTSSAPSSTPAPIASPAPSFTAPLSMPAPVASLPPPSAITTPASLSSLSASIASSVSLATIPVIAPSTRKYIRLVTTTLGNNFRQGQDAIAGHITDFVEISPAVLSHVSQIPSVATGRSARRRVDASRFSPVFVNLRKTQYRGDLPYCSGRPCALDESGNFVCWSKYGYLCRGEKCSCHGEPLDQQYHTRPHYWATTPAEEDVNPSRPRRVRFAGSKVVGTFEPWYLDAFGPFTQSEDPATEEDDDLAIEALAPPPPAIPPPTTLSTAKCDVKTSRRQTMGVAFDDEDLTVQISQVPPPAALPPAEPPPAKTDFDSFWKQAMAEGFDDDDDF